VIAGKWYEPGTDSEENIERNNDEIHSFPKPARTTARNSRVTGSEVATPKSIMEQVKVCYV
jgi:hypothetical protein